MRIVLTLILAAVLGTAAFAAESYHSMYARLGGYTGVHSISSDLVARLAADKRLASYFAGITPAQRAQLANYAADYACAQAGGRCRPTQPDIALVKNPPSPARAQINAALADLRATLAAHHVPSDIQQTIDALANAQ
jgi:hemoglobin